MLLLVFGLYARFVMLCSLKVFGLLVRPAMLPVLELPLQPVMVCPLQGLVSLPAHSKLSRLPVLFELRSLFEDVSEERLSSDDLSVVSLEHGLSGSNSSLEAKCTRFGVRS